MYLEAKDRVQGHYEMMGKKEIEMNKMVAHRRVFFSRTSSRTFPSMRTFVLSSVYGQIEACKLRGLFALRV